MNFSRKSSVLIGNDWDEAFQSLVPFVDLEKLNGIIKEKFQQFPFEVNPPFEDVFRAFKVTPLRTIKVVLLGQDPYPGHGVADGLSFSARYQKKAPASLININKELNMEFGKSLPPILDLTYLGKQGVFLYNTSLISRDGMPFFFGKVSEIQNFSEAVIKKINDYGNGIIFILLGNKAKAFSRFVNTQKNYVLVAAHPSPLSANRGFFGCGIFKKTNQILIKEGKAPIDWLGEQYL